MRGLFEAGSFNPATYAASIAHAFGEEIEDFGEDISLDLPQQEQAKSPNQQPQPKPQAPRLGPGETKFEREKQCVALPGHLAALVNSGDLDALRALVFTHFTKKSVLCVQRTSDKSVEAREYCGREHVNSYFAYFLDLMPDIVFTLRKSALSSRKQGGAVMFCLSFHGTTLCGLKNGPSRLHPYVLGEEGCPVKKAVGSLTNIVMRNVRRYFYPNEKAAMLSAEKEMRAGTALARIRGVMIGKLSFVPLRQANTEPIQVSRFEVTFKVNHLQGAPLPE